MDYLYDGTFDGLLTCVYYNYYNEAASGIFLQDEYQRSMLNRCEVVESDSDKADRVYSAICNKICAYDLGRTYKVFLSSVPGKENIILEYIKLGFKEGWRTWQLHGNEAVYAFQQAEKKVGAEIHRLKGILRFSVLEGNVSFAKVEPDNDVIELLAHHFSDRFKNNPFIIYDAKRQKAVLSGGGKWQVSYFDPSMLPKFSSKEKEYRKLWKNYYDTIAIKERANHKCRRSFMPVRYWKNITETQSLGL